MGNRKDLLTWLKERYGDCSRSAFISKLRNFFSEEPSQETISRAEETAPTPEDMPDIRALDINGTDAWRSHINRLKDFDLLTDCLTKNTTLLKKASLSTFAKSVNQSLEKIPAYVDKIFQEPLDIDEETSEDVARQTGKFVKDNIWDLIRGCRSGIKHSQGQEQAFYVSFGEKLEEYLSSIGVYRKNIHLGDDVRSNAKWFETPFIKETDKKDKMGLIDEIEVVPHFIPYRAEDNNCDELILKGVCIAFGEAKKK